MPAPLCMTMPGYKQELAVGLVRAGNTYQQAADVVGLTRNAVAGACSRAGVKVGFRASSLEAIRQANARMWNDPARGPELRQKMSRAVKARWRRYRRDAKEIEARHGA